MLSKKFEYLRRSAKIYFNRLLSREFIKEDQFSAVAVEVSGLCNLRCVFCAYKDKTSGKVILPNADFENFINQLTDLGHDHIMLTPQTGDVFVDKSFVDKLAFLENHPKIKGYEFITNLISASHSTLDYIARSKKLTRMYVSLYGHNAENFKKITERPETQYRRLLNNLDYLTDIAKNFKGGLSAFVMTNSDFDWSPYSNNAGGGGGGELFPK